MKEIKIDDKIILDSEVVDKVAKVKYKKLCKKIDELHKK